MGSVYVLNYTNLNDIEFEYLCQDVMSKKLGVELRRFAAGRDGGIDLTDNVSKKNIIVQVKHYIKTDISGFISSLKKEIPKVYELKPSQYYICCSKELSPANVKDIYTMFSDYMESDANIITLIEINDFLTRSENIDIVRNHYKLWISSTNILQDIYSNDIFIDCEVLLSNIHFDEKFFVQTVAYDRALECLAKKKTLFITGDPGVGKTITSKMIVLYYATNGYRVRYTTDGADLSALKRALSQNKEAKEIILLDDCFGQAYFNMKETQSNELLSLIKHVNIYENKRLILNSRVTIYREAQARTPELVKSFDNKEYKVHIIDMSAMPDIDKAKILYNHLYFNNVKGEYFESIKKNKNYRRIVNHPNYNPRIIEFVSSPHRYSKVSPSDYFDYILGHLNNPSKVWDDEYERRLSKVDRMLVTSLFSLTDTTAPLDFVNQCFNARIQSLPEVDLTINQFQNSLSRLQQAFVKIVDEKNKHTLSMVNPSINDYIRSRINTNTAEKEDLINTAASVMQLQKMLTPDEFKFKMLSAFNDGSILNYLFASDEEQVGFITYFISYNKILDMRYQQCIFSYLSKMKNVNVHEKQVVSAIRIFENLLDYDVYTFYQIDGFLFEADMLEEILSYFDLKELIDAINYCHSLLENEKKSKFIFICQNVLKEAVEIYCDCVDADDYDLNIDDFIKDSCKVVYYGHGEYNEEPDVDTVIQHIESSIKEKVKDEVGIYLDNLPAGLCLPASFVDEVCINVSGAEDLVTSYLRSDDDDEDRYVSASQANYSEIDLIFDR